ncbi:MAG TPA: hypothetical protein VHB48_04450 [Chitinophagaceae bacterium]|nr:hypothetical protein [Chitinophagaceae bacterium]
MKKLIQLCCMVLSAGIIHAQSTLHISTDYKQTCYWNDSKSTFDNCGTNEEYSSLFTLNAGETMFTHTTADIKSSYYVKSKEYKSEYDSYVYDVTSDVGNKYTFIIDLKNKLVKILSSGHSNASDDYLLKFSIKNSWND